MIVRDFFGCETRRPNKPGEIDLYDDEFDRGKTTDGCRRFLHKFVNDNVATDYFQVLMAVAKIVDEEQNSNA